MDQTEEQGIEFEKRFDQLSAREQTSLEGEKVELFVEAADPVLQKSFVKDLEDPKGELGLTSTWKRVLDVISLIIKCQKRSDKLNVVVKEKESKTPPSTSGSKSKQEEMLEDVTKQLCKLRLNYKKVDDFLSSTLPYHPVQTTQ